MEDFDCEDVNQTSTSLCALGQKVKIKLNCFQVGYCIYSVNRGIHANFYKKPNGSMLLLFK